MITSKLKHRIIALSFIPFLLFAEAAVIVPLFQELDPPEGERGTMDSVAIYVASDPGQSLIFFTDKDEGYVEIYNPVTNTFLGKIGGNGSGPGQLSYPNGVAVAYGVNTGSGKKDVLFVVERDNHRVSTFSLPDRTFLGHFGSGDLGQPYGIELYWRGEQLQAWITETDSSPDRVYVYNVLPAGAGLRGNFRFSFETAGYLESLAIDPASARLLLCDEGDGQDVMVYDLQGNLLQRFGQGLFVDEPEGVVIYDLGGGEGYLIVADQNAEPTEFEVFDRKTLQSLGHFSGPTRGTDGIALTQAALPNLPNGSFYAVHSDETVHVYDWAEIAKAMGLRTNVISPPTEVAERESSLPRDFEILSSFPNPFNPQTTLRYRLERQALVRLEIYTLTGRRIMTLVNAMQAAGEHQITWEGKSEAGEPAATGVYIANLTVGEEAYRHKIMLVK